MMQSRAATALVMHIVYMKPGRLRETRVFIVQPGRIANRNCVIIGGNIINNSKATNAASPLMSGGRAIWYIRRHLQRRTNHSCIARQIGVSCTGIAYLRRNCISNPYCVYSTPNSPSMSFPFPFFGFFFQISREVESVPGNEVTSAHEKFMFSELY
jgi:hypothetical protein